MYIRFRECPTKDELLEKLSPFYRGTMQTMWECYELGNMINSYGFELIRLKFGNMQLIVHKTIHWIKFTLTYCKN